MNTSPNSPAQRHKSELIEQISQVFLSLGFDGATLTELSKATGLSKATLYHHFPRGKEEMAAVILRQSIAKLQQLAFSQLNGERAAQQRLITWLEGFARYTRQGRQPCLLATLQYRAADIPALQPLAENIRQQFIDWQQTLADTLQSSGLKPKRAAREAQDLMSVLYGALVHANMQNSPAIFTDTVKRIRKRFIS